jgi:hypothetical protein
MQVYIQNDRLSYVVSIPLVNKGESRAYYLVPVTIPVNKDRLIYIKAAKSILCVDNVRQYYYSVLKSNYRNARNPLSIDMCVGRTSHYCLV